MKLSSNNFLGVLYIGIFELLLEKIGHQHSSHVQSFLSIMISIVLVSLSKKGIKQSSRHVSNKVSLPAEAVKISPNMRDNLFHEDISCIFYLSINIRHSSDLIYESPKERQTLTLLIECNLFYRVPEDLDHSLLIIKLITKKLSNILLDDALENLDVCLHSQAA